MVVWIVFTFIALTGLFVAVQIIGVRRVLNLRHFAAIFLGLMTLTYLLRPLATFVFGSRFTLFETILPNISVLILDDLLPLALLFATAVISFALGYRLLQREDLKPLGGRGEPKLQQLYARLALIVVAAGYLSFIVAERGFFGQNASFTITSGGTGYANTTGYVELANYLVIAGAFLFYASTGRLLPSSLLTLPWLASQLFFGWSRLLFVVLALGFFAIWLLRVPAFRFSRTQAIALVLGVLAAAGLLVGMRSNRFFLQQDESFVETLRQTVELPVDQVLGDFAGFEGTWYVYRTMQQRTPRYGTTLLYQFVVKPVPRIWWRGKPFPGEFSWNYVASYLGYRPQPDWAVDIFGLDDTHFFTGASRGSIGDALWEWGWPGVFINFFATGLFLAWMERRLLRSQLSVPWMASYAATYGMIAMLARDAIYSNQSTLFIIIFYAPYFVINWFANQHIRRGQLRPVSRPATAQVP